MHVAVVSRPDDPVSLRIYAANMTRQVGALGAEIVPFGETGPIPVACDVVWDPGLCMRRVPAALRDSRVPVIGTVHGVKAFSLPLTEVAADVAGRQALAALTLRVKEDWAWFGTAAAAIAGVSDYAAEEAANAFELDRRRIHVVYNGVDPGVFNPVGPRADLGRPYLLCVARLDPIKNVQRLVAAYARLPEPSRPTLVLVLPREAGEPCILAEWIDGALLPGIHLVREEVPQAALACWYRGAIALVLPSLRETFGLPIVEAMACGCPVICSWDTGCAEVAGDAAVLVDPRSVHAIATAMQRLAQDDELCCTLRRRGLLRARCFSWRASAVQLARVFHKILDGKSS